MKKNNRKLISVIKLIWKSKLLMAMRATLFVVIISITQVFATHTYSQSTRLSVDFKSTSIKKILSDIEDQSQFYFIYDATVVNVERKINIELENKLIPEILDEIFKGSNVVYKIDDRQIALSTASPVVKAQQTKSVSGTVTDDTGQPLPGVTVVVKGTTQGTVTNVDGEYSLPNIPENATLQFSFVGMRAQEIPVAGKTNINVVLTQDAIDIEEVVAIGYGVTKKTDLTGSVASISAERLREAPITRLEEGLQGKISGVRIQNSDGTPGAGLKVRIRGSSSISFSNDPLYVVDGFIGADIATVNPKDISSIDILKDASATAIYGSRGSNGVVIITTNSPKVGDMRISVDASYGRVDIPKFIEMSDLGQSLEWLNEKLVAEGSTPAISQEEMDRLIQQGGTDWQKEVTQLGSKSEVNIGLTGGTEKLQYYFSGNYYDEEGVMLNSGYRRYSVRSNVTSELAKGINMVFNTFGVSEENFGVGRLTAGDKSTFGKAFKYPRIWPAYDEEGNPTNPDLMDDYSGNFNSSGRANPLELLTDRKEKNFKNTIQSNLDLTFDLTDYLKLTISNSGKYRSGYKADQGYIAPPEKYRKDVDVSQGNGHYTSLLNYDMLTFNKKFGKHSFKADAIYEFSKSTSYSNDVTVSNLSTLGTGYHALQVGIPTTATSNFAEIKWRAYMGRLNYSFKDRYLITTSIRADGSSKFKKENRWGYFPSLAFAWRLSEEGFIKNSTTITNLKFRLGYGEVGNANLPAYSTLQLLTANNASYDYYEATSPAIEPGVLPGSLVDPDMKWEVAKQFNTGLDFALFSGRLSGVVDYYNKRVEDLIFRMAIPSINGTGTYLANIGRIRNTGLEFSLDGIIVDKSDFSMRANFNVAFNDSKVLNLGEVDRMWITDAPDLGMPDQPDKFVVNVGEPLGQLWGYKWLGTWKTGEETEAARYGAEPGNIRYADLNDDGKYDAGDKQVIANTTPKTTVGFGLNLKYKNLDLAVNGYGSLDYEIYNRNRYYGVDDPKVANRWTPENQSDELPKWDNYNSGVSGLTSHGVEKGDFIKLGNATLGYSFSKSLLHKLGIDNTRVYVSGSNLLTITNYSGTDPEASITPIDSDAIGGIDNFGYPSIRTITFGINLSF